MRLLLCRTCLQYSFSLLRFIMKEWFCRYGTGPPMVKWYYSICKQLQFIVDIRNRNRKESCSKLTLFLKGGLSLIFRKHFLFAASVNCPVIDNQRKWGCCGGGGLEGWVSWMRLGWPWTRSDIYLILRKRFVGTFITLDQKICFVLNWMFTIDKYSWLIYNWYNW